MSDEYARARHQRDRENVIGLAVLGAISLTMSGALYGIGGPTRGWSAVLLIASMGAWALFCKGAYHVTSTALMQREPDWPERFQGDVVPPSAAVARYWRNVLLAAVPITLVPFGILAVLIATHTRANDAMHAVFAMPAMFGLLAASVVCLEAFLLYRMATRGYVISPDEWSDGNGYVEGVGEVDGI